MWKYKIEIITITPLCLSTVVDKLNELGAQGWEAFNISIKDNYDSVYPGLQILRNITYTVTMKKPF